LFDLQRKTDCVKYIIKIAILSIWILSISSCVDENAIIKQEASFFNLKEYFEGQTEILSQKSKVYKATSIDGRRIEKELDDLNFKQELKVFEDSDINKVAWLDKYQVDSVYNESGNLNQISYRAIDEKLRTQLLVISYDLNTVDTISIYNNSSGSVAILKQYLEYIPSFGYSIRSTQKTTFSKEHVVAVDVRFSK